MQLLVTNFVRLNWFVSYTLNCCTLLGYGAVYCTFFMQFCQSNFDLNQILNPIILTLTSNLILTKTQILILTLKRNKKGTNEHFLFLFCFTPFQGNPVGTLSVWSSNQGLIDFKRTTVSAGVATTWPVA